METKNLYVELSPRGFSNETSLVRVASEEQAKLLISGYEYATSWQGKAWIATPETGRGVSLDLTEVQITDDNSDNVARVLLNLDYLFWGADYNGEAPVTQEQIDQAVTLLP